MKIYLCTKYQDIKDNDPPGQFHVHPESRKDQSKQKKQGIHKDGPIAEYDQGSFEPGQGQYLVGTTGRFAVHFHIPERHRNQETDIAQDSKFGKEAHGVQGCLERLKFEV